MTALERIDEVRRIGKELDTFHNNLPKHDHQCEICKALFGILEYICVQLIEIKSV